MSEFGDRLRAAREAQGLTLRQIEEATRIRQVFLQAMEEERFADLPDAVYARGFIRSYAAYLGLDAEALLCVYRDLAGEPPVAVPQVLNEPLTRPLAASLWGRTWRWLLAVALLAALGWLAYSHFALRVDPWPLSLLSLPLRTPTAQLPTPRPTPAPPTPLPLATPTITRAASSTSMPTVRPSATPSRTIAPMGRSGTLSPTAPTGAIQVRAVISATTYLEVTADEVRVYTGTLLPGQERTFAANSRLALRVGNAGGLQLIVNGVTAPPLGQTGQVVEVIYTPQNLPTR